MAHEALLTGWCPLDAATADIAAALSTARAVEQSSVEWISAGRSENYLWDDKRLTATLAMLGMTSDDGHHNSATPPLIELDDQAREFLDATTRRVTAVKDRDRRRRPSTIAVLSTLLVLALIASVVAFQQRASAQAQRETPSSTRSPPRRISYAVLVASDFVSDTPVGNTQPADVIWRRSTIGEVEEDGNESNASRPGPAAAGAERKVRAVCVGVHRAGHGAGGRQVTRRWTAPRWCASAGSPSGARWMRWPRRCPGGRASRRGRPRWPRRGRSSGVRATVAEQAVVIHLAEGQARGD